MIVVKQGLVITVAIFVLAAMSGCSDLGVTQSGFLKDYSKMEPFKFKKKMFQDAKAFIYEREMVNWGQYQCAIVEPVEITGPAKYLELDKKNDKAIRQYLQQSLRESLGRNNYVNVDHTKEHAIRVRAAVTDVETSEPLINTLTLATVRMPIDMGGSSIEVEISDAMTGEVLCRMVAFGNGNFFQVLHSLDKLGQAQLAIDKWSEGLAQKIRHEPTRAFAKAKVNPELAPF